ncbi:MAG: aconitase X catalytic domain-containing protein [Pseudomonadales bacterium]
MKLTANEIAILEGKNGKAQQFAMSLLQSVGEASAADCLIPISQAHLVGSYYGGPADIAFLRHLNEMKAKVRVHTTLNACSAELLDRGHYPADHPEVKDACEVVKYYRQMGCAIELTCAPYHLPKIPRFKDNIAWAESNAVVYANSVIGARTNKTFQYLDLCAAICGLIPRAGLYLEQNRRADTICHANDLPSHWLKDDAIFQLIGYLLGRDEQLGIAVLSGIPAATDDQLRGMGAAAAAAGNIDMFHAVGITPEASSLDEALHNTAAKYEKTLTADMIRQAYSELAGTGRDDLGAVCIGTPHFSFAEFDQLVDLMQGRKIHEGIPFYVSTSRHVHRQLTEAGTLESLEACGIDIVIDTCTYYGLLVKDMAGVIMTNSVKWAYYAPGNLQVEAKFARLSDCVESAILGRVTCDRDFWHAA